MNASAAVRVDYGFCTPTKTSEYRSTPRADIETTPSISVRATKPIQSRIFLNIKRKSGKPFNMRPRVFVSSRVLSPVQLPRRNQMSKSCHPTLAFAERNKKTRILFRINRNALKLSIRFVKAFLWISSFEKMPRPLPIRAKFFVFPNFQCNEALHYNPFELCKSEEHQHLIIFK